MGIFKDINQNLFKMYFKQEMNFHNQYEYLISLYIWDTQRMEQFKFLACDHVKTSSKWMAKRLPKSMFYFPQNDKCLLDFDNLFYICYSHLRETLHITNNTKLANVLQAIIFHSDSETECPFSWNENDKHIYMRLFKKFDAVQILASLLIYAQIEKILTPYQKYELVTDASFVTAYSKRTLEKSLDTLLINAKEINMSQISCPSLMEEYADFFKRTNKMAILEALTNNPELQLNFLFMDPEIPNAEILLKAYMYGDSFSQNTEVIEDSIQFALSLKKKFPGQIDVRKVTVPMSYSIFQVKYYSSPSVIKIDIYSPIKSADDRFSLLMNTEENRELYDHFSKVFYSMFYNLNAKVIE